ncbi:hypothetical protein ACUSIJ_10935 [Pseudochelatococcus sp. B33]
MPEDVQVPEDPDADQARMHGCGSRVVEWTIAGAASLVVGAMMIYLAYQALNLGDRPPEFIIMTERIDRVEAGTVVSVALHNRGEVAAAAVTLISSIRMPSGAVETQELVFDYVPARSVRRGAVIFPSALMMNGLTFQIGGYREL